MYICKVRGEVVLQDEEDKEAASSPHTRTQPEDRVKPPYSYVAMIGGHFVL